MKVQSTGLGKTVMLAHFQDLLKTHFDDEQVLQMNMESTEPLHWTIKVYMEPADIRRAVLMGLRPSILWKALMAIVFGRFSLFGGKAAAPETKTRLEEKSQPAESKGIAAVEESGAKDSPLSSLKNGARDDKTTNPLARLKG